MAKSDITRNRLQLYWDHADPTQHYACMVVEHLKALPARQRNDWLREAVVNHLARFLADDSQGMTPSLQSAHHFARLLATDLGISLSDKDVDGASVAFEASGAPRSRSTLGSLERRDTNGVGKPSDPPPARVPLEPAPQNISPGNDQHIADADTAKPSQANAMEKAPGSVKNTALGGKLKGMMGG